MTATTNGAADHGERRASWAPMVALFLAQVLMSVNVAAIPVSLGGMVADFEVPPTTVSTAVVMYGLVVAAFVMVGAKIGQRVGWVLVFRVVVAFFAVSSAMMVFAGSVWWAIGAQAVAGACAAVIVPSLVALIAENYRGEQQATAVGSLGSARAVSGVFAFLVGGTLATFVSWRIVFVLVFAIAVATFLFSFRLRPASGSKEVKVDVMGAALIGAAVIALSLGFNNLNGWGVLTARATAPFSVAGVSPAPLLVVVGLFLGQCFFWWSRRRLRRGKAPLVSLSVLGASSERSAVYAMFVVVALEAALNFAVPLYIQIVQGRTSFDTSLAMMPFNLTVFVVATLVVRFYRRFSPRVIGVFSFALTTIGLVWLSFVVTNNWETLPTILGLVVFGIGQGALVTLVFNVLVTAAPKELSGDVGSIRGTTQNLASAVGTSLAGALLVTILGINIAGAVSSHTELPRALVAQVDLDNPNFVRNSELRATLAASGASAGDIEAAVGINTQVRLSALRTGLLILGAVSALAIVPAARLPRFRPGEIPTDQLTSGSRS